MHLWFPPWQKKKKKTGLRLNYFTSRYLDLFGLLIGLPTFFSSESLFPINMMFKHDDEEEVSGSEEEEEKEGEHAVSMGGGGGVCAPEKCRLAAAVGR